MLTTDGLNGLKRSNCYFMKKSTTQDFSKRILAAVAAGSLLVGLGLSFTSFRRIVQK